jgi:hypothetical protein
MFRIANRDNAAGYARAACTVMASPCNRDEAIYNMLNKESG